MVTALIEIKNDNAEAACLPQGGERHKAAWPLPYSPPTPAPTPAVPATPAVQGRREAPSQATSFPLSGAVPGGVSCTGASDGERKEIPTSCQERLSLGNAMPPPWVQEKFGTVQVGEAVILCLLSPEHHPTYILKSQLPLLLTSM